MVVMVGRGGESEQKICGSGLYRKFFASHLLRNGKQLKLPKEKIDFIWILAGFY